MTACWLIAIRMMFKMMSFERLTGFVARRKIKDARARAISLARLAAIIQNAAKRVPGTCLSRSLAGAIVLARFGYDSQVQIGVSAEKGFEAHAWLESGGTPITEPDIPASRWKELTRITVSS
jgi:hypothetical protein